MLDCEFEQRELHLKYKTRHRLPVQPIVKRTRNRSFGIVDPTTIKILDENCNEVKEPLNIQQIEVVRGLRQDEKKIKRTHGSRRRHRKSRSHNQPPPQRSLTKLKQLEEQRLVQIPDGPKVEVRLGMRHCRVESGSYQYLLRLRKASGEVVRVLSKKPLRK